MSILKLLFSSRAREYVAASRRWARTNAQKRAAGCPCGAEATHVRRCGGTHGAYPAEIWTCAEHTNVNGWQRAEGEAHSTPLAGCTFDGMDQWVGSARPA